MKKSKPHQRILTILILAAVFIIVAIVLPKVFTGDGLSKFSGDELKIAKKDREMATSFFDVPLARFAILGYEIEKVTKIGDDITFCGQQDLPDLPPGKFERKVRVYTFFGLTFRRMKIDCNEVRVL